MDFLGALILTAGIGQTDHRGWINAYGANVGKVAITQELVTTKKTALQLTIEHWSSPDTSEDRGMNTGFLEFSYRVK